MRTAVLTTDTLHHAHFVREIHARFPLCAAVLETQSLSADFPCRHAFEDARDAHERALFFGGRAASVKDFYPAREHASANDAAAIADLRAAAPDAILVFGTGILRAPLLQAFPGKVWNLHGGDPEEYRGLDSHLWAVYHRDFRALVTTLHFAASTLDTGDIILQGDVPVQRGMGLHELRAANTGVCLDLCLAALASFAASGKLPSRRQRKQGRYYSFMPAVLKEACVRKFAAHAGNGGAA